MRIAVLAHSTNPRGGVVHALALGDALTRLGHEAVVHAPDAAGTGFFRPTLCGTRPIPARPFLGGTADLVEARVADYVAHFGEAAHRRFDVFHAQDGISGNALATLKDRGLIHHFVRTVHHIDSFADVRVGALQVRAIRAADAHFTVSPLWRRVLRRRWGLDATVVGNGVDRAVFTPEPDGSEGVLKARYGLGPGPVFLAIGGVEARKNSMRILEAFAVVRRSLTEAQLVIGGGASLLDHGAYQRTFDEALLGSGLPPHALIRTGPLPQADVPSLYRLADCLVFPSLKEGFGLVVLEAMASGIPVVVPRLEPFTSYLGGDDAVWCDPLDAASIARAMVEAIEPARRAVLRRSGLTVAARHDWETTARAHLGVYAAMREAVLA